MNTSNTISLNYGVGPKLNDSSQLVVDTSTIEPWFSPQLPLAITGSGTNAKLNLNIGWALKLDGSNLAVDADVLRFGSNDRGAT